MVKAPGDSSYDCDEAQSGVGFTPVLFVYISTVKRFFKALCSASAGSPIWLVSGYRWRGLIGTVGCSKVLTRERFERFSGNSRRKLASLVRSGQFTNWIWPGLNNGLLLTLLEPVAVY